ncbi:MAG: MFS transporter [Sphingobacteriales bacterium]|nr:MAG: MFS transporter [Sphingobacteriales bacterium]
MSGLFQLYRNAYSGLAPSTWWLSLVMLINRSGTMVVPFMTLYMTQKLGYTIAQAGWVMAVFGAGAVCGGFIGGKLIDRFGFYYIQIVTLLGGGLLFMVLGQMTSYPMICLFAFILSLVNDMFRPANAAAIAHFSKEENRTRSFSLNRLAINLGWAMGGALGGFIASKNYELLFWIDGFTNMGAAVMLWLTLAPSKNKASQHTPIVEKIPADQSPYRDRPYLLFFLLSIMFAYCFFQLFTTMPVFYRKELNLTETFIGSIMAMNGLIIAFTEMILIHSLERRGNYMNYIVLGVVMIGCSFIMFNILPGFQWLAIGAMLMMTLGEMFSMPFMNTYWISRTNDANRGQYAGLYTVAWSIAQVIGPGSGAQIADRYGFELLWWITGIVCLVTAFGFWILGKLK